MSCGYWISLNGHWVALEGVQAGVGRETERPSSSFTSVGGVRHAQSARRAARSWTLDFGQSTPDAVTALAVAAQGDGGDVWLWDESIARQNLLDPVPLAARPGYPVVMCGAMPLASLTAGPTASTTTDSVSLKANLRVQEAGDSTINEFIVLSPGEVDAIVKVTIPPTPAGMDLVSAELVLTAAHDVDGTINAHVTSNAWTEGRGGVSWDTPAGALLGSAAAAPTTVIPLGDVSVSVGTDLSLRLSQTGGTGSTFRSRFTTDAPLVRLTYAVLAEDRVFPLRLRPGGYTLAFWTDAPGGTEIGTIGLEWDGEWVTGPLAIDDDGGTGLRYVSVALDIPDPGQQDPYIVTIVDSADYVLAGPMMSTLGPAEPDSGVLFPTAPAGVYMAAQKTPVRVRVEDPSLVLDRLLAGEQGVGQRTATLHEVGA